MIRKVVLPAAGFGTRMLPATKAIPKEMLPVVDKPVIQYAIEEAYLAGLDHIILITSKSKLSIEQHFGTDNDLTETVLESNRSGLLADLEQLSQSIKISSVIQKSRKGLADAIYQAKSKVGDESFAVILPDDIIVSNGSKSALIKMIELYKKVNSTVIAVEKVADEMIPYYGIVKAKESFGPDCFEIGSLIEKPKIDEAPSNMAVIGRYIFGTEIFRYIEKMYKDNGGYLEITTAINNLIKDGNRCYAVILDGIRYDTGDKFGFIRANIELALKDKTLSGKLRSYLRSKKFDQKSL